MGCLAEFRGYNFAIKGSWAATKESWRQDFMFAFLVRKILKVINLT